MDNICDVAVLGAPATGDSLVGIASYVDQGRARVVGRAQGLVRLYAATPDGRLTESELFAPGADHMANLLALAIARGEMAASLLDLPFYHPTLEEGLKLALREIRDASGISVRDGRDGGDPPGASGGAGGALSADRGLTSPDTDSKRRSDARQGHGSRRSYRPMCGL